MNNYVRFRFFTDPWHLGDTELFVHEDVLIEVEKNLEKQRQLGYFHAVQKG